MRFIRKRSFGRHTIMRSDRLQVGAVKIHRNRVPPEGVDPYGLDFNQHDDRNYSVTWTWALNIGSVSLEWRSQKPNTLTS